MKLVIKHQIRKLSAAVSGSTPVRGLVFLPLAIALLGYVSVPWVSAAPPQYITPIGNLSNSQLDPIVPEQPAERLQSVPAMLSGADAARLLLPDLQTLHPSDLEIETLPDGSRELRLSNMIWNSGAGPLELEGFHDARLRQTKVIQRVKAQVGSQFENLVGEFIFHPTHEHWHFEDFTIYELWSLTPFAGLDEVVSSSNKLSYCVIDTDVIDPQNQNYTPRRVYYGCGRRLQGLSAGWGDEYESHLDGQSIHLAGIKDGYYALVSTANPESILLESNYSNNTAMLYFEIRGETIELLSPDEMSDRRCTEYGRC